MDRDLTLDDDDLQLTEGGSFYVILKKFGLKPPSRIQRILIYVTITWGMLAILSAVQGVFWNPQIKVPFICDIAEACRLLVVGPILIGAKRLIEPWLVHVVRHFRRFVSPEDQPKLQVLIDKSGKMRDSILVDILLIAFAFIRPHFGQPLELSSDLTSWQMLPNGEHTWAYGWMLYAARPFFLILWLRWMWRYVIWSLLLCRIASLKLNVISSHPDRMGGLSFVTAGHTKFAILVLAFGIQASASILDMIWFDGASVSEFKYTILAATIITVIIFITPLFAFTPKLIDCKRRGLFEYGALADEYTDAVHAKWIQGERPENEPLLGNGDIQTFADLGNIFENVREMQATVITKGTVLIFVMAAAAPFAPLLLTAYPLDDLIERLVKVAM
jgi:hypothetical protein